MFRNLGPLLGKSLTKFGIFKELEAYQLLSATRDILKTRNCARVIPRVFKDGVLTLEVPHYTLAHELRAEEDEIIFELKKRRFSGVRRIEIRVLPSYKTTTP